MIIIKIEDSAISTKTGSKDGRTWTMNRQQISISGHFVDGFPAKNPRDTTIQLEEINPQPYPPGLYTIAPDAFFFGDYDRFTLGRLKLQPLNAFLNDVEKQLNITINKPHPKAA